MKPMLNRILKTVCVVVAAGMLTACGSGSTVDPFRPTRVIGLGDAYNDMGNNQATVRGTADEVGEITTVVEQLRLSLAVALTFQAMPAALTHHLRR